MAKQHRLGDLQLAILRELWSRGEATVAEVHAALLPERGLAPTTIATMLRKMGDRKLVTHRTEGRQFVYRACVEEADVHHSMVNDLIDRVFGGEPSALVSHLLNEQGIDEDELARIRAMIDQADASADTTGGANDD
jgi:predicted transcriptional regulator